jgi:putative tryptophan/tyrosine transport system substrate-binding protein
MNRRAFITGLGTVLTAPLAARAQQAGKVPTIGWVEAGSQSTNQHFLDAFRQGLRDLKYIEGQNIVVEDRWAGGQEDQFSKLIAELIRLNVDLVVVASTSGAIAAKSATRTTPVVFWGASDPVGIGVVSSLGHPGGNITGVSLGLEDGLAPKWLELIKEVVPKSSRIAVLWNPDARGSVGRVKELRMAAATVKVTIQDFEVHSVSEFDGAFNAMSSMRVGGVIVMMTPLTLRHREHIVRLALHTRLPAIYGFSEFARAGGLLTYGPSVPDQARRVAFYVDKILKGAKPADLPVEQPTKFELVINLKTAKALGLTIPPSLLLRADQVIE